MTLVLAGGLPPAGTPEIQRLLEERLRLINGRHHAELELEQMEQELAGRAWYTLIERTAGQRGVIAAFYQKLAANDRLLTAAGFNNARHPIVCQHGCEERLCEELDCIPF